MKKNKRLKQISLPVFVISLSLLLSGCASAPDIPACVEIHPAKGYCIHTISDKEFVVDDQNLFDGQSWWQMRPTMVMIPAKSYGELKAFVIKSCKKTKDCEKNITTYERQIKKIDDKLSEKKLP